MSKAIAHYLPAAYWPAAYLQASPLACARTAIVGLCAAALIVAERALPFV